MSNWGEEALGPQFLNTQDSHAELEFPLQLRLQSVESRLHVTHFCQPHRQLITSSCSITWALRKGMKACSMHLQAAGTATCAGGHSKAMGRITAVGYEKNEQKHRASLPSGTVRGDIMLTFSLSLASLATVEP